MIKGKYPFDKEVKLVSGHLWWKHVTTILVTFKENSSGHTKVDIRVDDNGEVHEHVYTFNSKVPIGTTWDYIVEGDVRSIGVIGIKVFSF